MKTFYIIYKKFFFKFILVISLTIINITIVKCQVFYTTGFDMPGPFPSQVLPFGWTQGTTTPLSPYNLFDRVTMGNNPFVLPLSNPAMLHYNASNIPAGETNFVASNVFSMVNTPAAGGTFNFWMYRDGNTYQSNTDNIQVYVNTIPDITGATLLTENQTSAWSLNRSCALSPTPVICNSWNQYFYTIPNAFNQDVYIIFKGTSANGNDIFIDDLGVTSYPSPQYYVPNSAETVYQDTNIVAPASINNVLIGCKLTMAGAAAPLPVLTNMGFNMNGTTNLLDVLNYKLWYTGGTPTFNGNTATYIGAYFMPMSNFTMIQLSSNYTGLSSFTNLSLGDNYFWLTVDVKATAVIGNCIDAEWINVNINNPGPGNITPNPSALPGCRPIGLTTGINSSPQANNLEIESIVKEGENGINVNFESNTSINYSYKIVDVIGKNIAIKEKNQALPGSNNISIPLKAHSGVYFLIIQNEHNVRVKKFMYQN